MNFEKIKAVSLENGATKSAVIQVDSIVLSKEFREICKSNQCGYYGKCWMCPPDIGEIDELMKKIGEYSYALLYQTIHTLEDSFDIEGMSKGSFKHCRISRKVEKALDCYLPDNYLHLICGGCRYCKKCAKQEGKECYYPSEALASMEAYGIDVYQTSKTTDLKYINGANTVTYFSIILFGEK